jgi:hypothetical protein
MVAFRDDGGTEIRDEPLMEEDLFELASRSIETIRAGIAETVGDDPDFHAMRVAAAYSSAAVINQLALSLTLGLDADHIASCDRCGRELAHGIATAVASLEMVYEQFMLGPRVEVEEDAR